VAWNCAGLSLLLLPFSPLLGIAGLGVAMLLTWRQNWVTQWKFAWQMVLQRPWTGWGLRNFYPLYQRYFAPLYPGHISRCANTDG
jgi:O-antigen ligase